MHGLVFALASVALAAPRCSPALDAPTPAQLGPAHLVQSSLDAPAIARGGAFAARGPPRIALKAQQRAWARFIDAVAGDGRAGASNADAPRPIDARIIAVGGSMPAGMRCHNPRAFQTQSECAYPSGLARALSAFTASARALEHREPANIAVANLCQGGVMTAAVLPMLPAILAELRREEAPDRSEPTAAPGAEPPTLFLIDFSANDAAEYWDPQRAAEAVAATEALVRFLLRNEPRFALLLCETYPALSPTLPRVSSAAYERVSAHYGLAHVRYTNVIAEGQMRLAWHADGCPLLRTQPPSQDALPSPPSTPTVVQRGRNGELLLRDKCEPHPFRPTHELIAHVVASSVLALGRALKCGGGAAAARASALSQIAAISPAELLARMAVCERPAAQYLARAAFESWARRASVVAADNRAEPIIGAGGGWRLYEDRPGKPGWIAEGPLGSTLAFPLRFGAVPQVAFAFLQGFDSSLGAVQLRVTDVREPAGTASLQASEVVAAQRRRKANGNWAQVSARSPSVIATQASVLLLEAWRLESEMRAGSNVKNVGMRHAVGFGIAPYSNATLIVTLVCEAPGECRCRPEANGSAPARPPAATALERAAAPAAPAAAGPMGAVVGCKFKVLSVTAC